MTASGSGELTAWFALIVVCIALMTMLLRPRGVNESWIALGGAIAMLILRAVAITELPGIVEETSGVLLFLLGMMVITGIVDRAGLFDLLAERCVALSRGNGPALYVLVFLLGAVVTAVLSLDVTVIMLTPIVYAVTRRRGLDPLPFMFACTFVANTASLIFPVSNLTNLLLYEQLELPFAQFAAVMWFPNLVAMLTNLVIFLWLFRRSIPRHIPAMIPDDTDTGMPALKTASGSWQRLVGTVLALSLGALFLCGLVGWPLWWAAGAGAGLAFVPAMATRRVTIHQTAGDVSWPLFVFVIAMTVLVRGVEHTWLDDLRITAPVSTAGMITSGVLSGAVGSNMINNVPMTVLALPLLEGLPEGQQSVMSYAVLVGTNIGPALTTYGSLATMLWLTLVRKQGMTITTRSYLKVSLLTVPIVLLTTSLALWVVLR